jgi:hypothetical protein
MNLLFEETPNRHQCGYEVVVNGLTMPCSFSSSKKVTIPAGLQLSEGKFASTESDTVSTFSICANHQKRLQNAFREYLQNTKDRK